MSHNEPQKWVTRKPEFYVTMSQNEPQREKRCHKKPQAAILGNNECCRGVVVITTAQLHSTQPELKFCAGSNPARGVSEIHDGEDLWRWSRLEIRLNAFGRSTTPQNNFIIITASYSETLRATMAHSRPLSIITSTMSNKEQHWRKMSQYKPRATTSH